MKNLAHLPLLHGKWRAGVPPPAKKKGVHGVQKRRIFLNPISLIMDVKIDGFISISMKTSATHKTPRNKLYINNNENVVQVDLR